MPRPNFGFRRQLAQPCSQKCARAVHRGQLRIEDLPVDSGEIRDCSFDLGHPSAAGGQFTDYRRHCGRRPAAAKEGSARDPRFGRSDGWPEPGDPERTALRPLRRCNKMEQMPAGVTPLHHQCAHIFGVDLHRFHYRQVKILLLDKNVLDPGFSCGSEDRTIVNTAMSQLGRRRRS